MKSPRHEVINSLKSNVRLRYNSFIVVKRLSDILAPSDVITKETVAMLLKQHTYRKNGYRFTNKNLIPVNTIYITDISLPDDYVDLVNYLTNEIHFSDKLILPVLDNNITVLESSLKNEVVFTVNKHIEMIYTGFRSIRHLQPSTSQMILYVLKSMKGIGDKRAKILIEENDIKCITQALSMIDKSVIFPYIYSNDGYTSIDSYSTVKIKNEFMQEH